MAMTAEAFEPEWTDGDRIVRARKHAKMEQADIASALGVSRSLVSMWERDLQSPRLEQLRRIAELTGVSSQWLLGVSSGSRCNPDSPVLLTDASYANTCPEQVELPFLASRRLSSVTD